MFRACMVWEKVPIGCLERAGPRKLPYTVPFRPTVQSRVTNNHELNARGNSSRVTGCSEQLRKQVTKIDENDFFRAPVGLLIY